MSSMRWLGAKFFTRYGEKPGTSPEELLGAAFVDREVKLADVAAFLDRQRG